MSYIHIFSINHYPAITKTIDLQHIDAGAKQKEFTTAQY